MNNNFQTVSVSSP